MGLMGTEQADRLMKAVSGVWPFFQSLAAIFSGGGFEHQVQGGGLNGGVGQSIEGIAY
jgi:hypothetical protein